MCIDTDRLSVWNDNNKQIIPLNEGIYYKQFVLLHLLFFIETKLRYTHKVFKTLLLAQTTEIVYNVVVKELEKL